ncbi:hypothetical protein V5O48_001168 [Marasmius crinis-equi]|uniref:Fungal-type protein kinase domain-containing protein n=1 Tax=Marasmius crinis-equi TaxID=585013 RepID=A0ABR3FZ94_9AGAR
MTLFGADHVRPYLTNDLQKTENIEFQKFLVAMTRILYRVEEERAMVLLGKILCSTSLIAQEESPNDLAQGATAAQKAIGEINANLQTYCQTADETHRYQWFVQACNSALSVLEWVDKDGSNSGLPPLPPSNIYFQRHDPTYIPGTHYEGEQSLCKPDVILASLAAVEQVWEKLTAAGSTIDVLADAHEKAIYAVPWDHVHSALEFKKEHSKLNIQLAALAAIATKTSGQSQKRKKAKHGWKHHDDAPAPVPVEELAAVSRDQIMEMIQQYVVAQKSNSERSGSLSGTPRDSAHFMQSGIPSLEPLAKTRTDQEHEKPPPAQVQVANYASEALNAAFGRAHILNWVIIDSRIYLWHFDRECPIQTNGFDFIFNLPHFLALLFLLQRFRPQDWGFVTTIIAPTIDVHPSTDIQTPTHSDSEEPQEKRKSLFFYHDRKLLKYTYGTSGRCTQVLQGTYGPESKVAVLKFSCPEISRDSESRFIVKARKTCTDPETLACLPELLGYKDYQEFETSKIRKFLGMEIVEKRPRMPRAIVLPFYLPITNLTYDWGVFMSAFWRLVRAHATLWARGIQHGDISASNLMYEDQNGEVVPKLCDYDLAHFSYKKGPTDFTNTGTQRFMAAELLTDNAMEGMVKKEYRHDCESFAWALIWILGRYCGGKLIAEPHFDDWKTPRYRDVFHSRGRFYDQGVGGRFVLRNIALPEGLFDLAFTFLVIFDTTSSEVRTRTSNKSTAEKFGDTKLYQTLDQEIRRLNSFSHMVSTIMKNRLFMDHKYGGKIHRSYLEGLTASEI